MNQSYLEANKCKRWEARENAGEQKIGFGFGPLAEKKAQD